MGAGEEVVGAAGVCACMCIYVCLQGENEVLCNVMQLLAICLLPSISSPFMLVVGIQTIAAITLLHDNFFST